MRTARIVLFACFILLYLLCAAKLDAQYFANSYAVVIGIDHYESPTRWVTLGYAVKDAKAIADLLRSQGFSVIPLYETQATKSAILTPCRIIWRHGLVATTACWFSFLAMVIPTALEDKSEGTSSPMTATRVPA